MKLEQQVTSLELSKRLRELGVKQESLWYWWKAGHIFVEEERYAGKQWEKLASAFTVAELGELLPDAIEVNNTNWTLTIEKSFTGSWDARYGSEVTIRGQADTEADARAKMLIYLLENNVSPLNTLESENPAS